MNDRTDKEWRQQLTAEQFEFTRRKGTEHPFTGKYHACRSDDIYHCVCCGAALSRSNEKFDAGSGLTRLLASPNPGNREQVMTNGMQRIEALCAFCDARLGYVFGDGLQHTGLRYCMNSIALSFKEK